DFFSDAKTGVQRVVGSGQMVYWRQCSLRVFETGKETDPPIQRFSTCNGQGLAKKGVSIIFDGGEMKEV
ncbi:hypothetical protein B0J15DRAFT_406335, partial [Fusarium solani]